MSSQMQITGNTCTITLDGDLTLPHAEELKKVLIKSLLDSDDIRVSMNSLEDADLSCLQLLCSAHRSAVRLKKRIGFSGSPAGPFRSIVEGAGFARLHGCKLDCENSCLWTVFSGERS
jgi:ABC-type transporter Mla MlaB component